MSIETRRIITFDVPARDEAIFTLTAIPKDVSFTLRYITKDRFLFFAPLQQQLHSWDVWGWVGRDTLSLLNQAPANQGISRDTSRTNRPRWEVNTAMPIRDVGFFLGQVWTQAYRTLTGQLPYPNFSLRTDPEGFILLPGKKTSNSELVPIITPKTADF